MIKAITLDLDDTLWPIAPAIERAEKALHAWFTDHAPEVAHRFDVLALRTLRDQVAQRHPHQAHDFTWVRHHSLQLALRECGHDEALADAAFAAFFKVRNELELFEEVDETLAALATRYPLLAVTNGNADLQLAGVAHHFSGPMLSARSFGVGKPDARIFHEACRRLGCSPAEVLHVGDDWALDVLGARSAGLQAAWLCRAPSCAPPEPRMDVWVIRHLGELATLAAR